MANDRAPEPRLVRAEALLRKTREELRELTADMADLSLAMRAVLDRIARLDHVLNRLDDGQD